MTAPCPSFGFIVSVAADSADDVRALVDELNDVLEASGLAGASRPRGRGAADVIVRREGSQTTEQDRVVALEWSARRAAAGHLVVGQLVDLAADA